MKNTLMIILIILFLLLITVVLFHNKRVVRFEVENAKTVFDSVPVRVFELHPDSSHIKVETVGKVQFTDEVYVVTQAQGQIKSVDVKIGERVKRGDVIARIDDYYASQEYNMARLAYEQLQKDYARYTELARVNAATQQQLEQMRLQVEAAQTKMNSLNQRMNDYIIKAPLEGVVNQLFVSRGNSTGLGTPVCEIVGGTSIKIEATVNPDQAKNLIIGQKASVTNEFGHGENFNAYLSEIGQKAGKFGGVAAIFRLDTSEKTVPASGGLVNIQVDIQGYPQLLLPRKALTYNEGVMGLFVLQEDNRVKFTSVKYLDFNDTYITVLDKELDHKQIVIEGNYMLKSGDLVKVIL